MGVLFGIFRSLGLAVRAVILTALLLVLAAILALAGLNRFYPPERAREAIERAATRYLERTIVMDSIEWSLLPPSLVGHGVRLLEADGREMVSCPKVRVVISFEPLLKERKVESKEMVLIGPQALLRRRGDGEFDLVRMVRQIRGRLREQKKSLALQPVPVVFKRFTVREGLLRFADEELEKTLLRTSLRFDGTGVIEGEPGKRTFPFDLSALVDHPEGVGRLAMTGVLGGRAALEFHSQDIPIQLLADHVALMKRWRGRVSCDGRWRAAADGKDWSVTGRLSRIKPKLSGPFPDVTGEFSLVPRSTSTMALELKDEHTEGRLELWIPPPSEKTAHVAFTSPKSDINRLLEQWRTVRPLLLPERAAPPEASTAAAAVPPEAAPSSVEVQPSTAPPAAPPELWRLEVEASIQDALFRDETFQRVRLRAERDKDGVLRVTDLRAEALGGALTAQATFYRLAEDAPPRDQFSLPPRFRLSWELADMDMWRFQQAAKIKKVFSGIGSSSGTLSGLISAREWTQTQGEAGFTVRDGMVWGLPGLLTTLSRMNLTSMIRGGTRDGEGGMPFKKAEARFRIGDGRILFDRPAVFENDTLQAAFVGTVDLAAQRLDARLAFNFLTFLDEVVKAIPGVRTLLMGKKKSIFPVVFKVTGPLQTPAFDYQAGRSLLAPFMNILRFPAALFQNGANGEKEKALPPPAPAPDPSPPPEAPPPSAPSDFPPADAIVPEPDPEPEPEPAPEPPSP